MIASPSARRARFAHALVLLVPALLFGFLVVVQWRTQLERGEIAARYNAPLTGTARALQDEQNALKAQLADLRARLDEIQKSAASQSGAARDLQARVDDLRARAGITARSGDGVVVHLDDAPRTPAARDPDKSACRAPDITDIVNTAWRGDAQAVAVNDERIVATSSVYCVGSTIIVNGGVVSPPFTIAAIGPQGALLGAFDDPNQLRDLKQRRDAQGLVFRVTSATRIAVPAYTGALGVRQAQAY